VTPAEQTRLINEGLNALTEQLGRVNEALELLVASLNEPRPRLFLKYVRATNREGGEK